MATEIVRSLDEISTGYTVFERDQVLNEEHLNQLATYLDDQDRLTRVSLLGVGIVCGLEVALEGTRVRVTRGVGVTTDGDLLRLAADAGFDRFKPYDRTAPVYPPFYRGEEMLPVFELVEESLADDRAAPLGELAGQAGEALGNLVALLLMESTVQDDDPCSGTDCDNLGQDAVHTPKLLLLRPNDLAALAESLPTLDQAGRALPAVVAGRVLIPPGTATEAALAKLYQAVCTGLHTQLAAAFARLFPVCGSFLGGQQDALFATDPAPRWKAALETARAKFAQSTSGIQYYYDFLKDLAETWEAFRDLLFGDTTLCCPDLGAFPKHLLLGGLDNGAPRTGLYPSPLVSRTAGQLDHARFLARKLDALLATFSLPAGRQPLRVTPSNCEDRSLEERAIPYYYAPGRTPAIHQAWSHRQAERGAERTNYSYHADRFRGAGAAEAQLTTQIGRFDFFRVEGHLGHEATAAVRQLEAEIRAKNLPFQVRAVALGADRTKVTVKPPLRYTDLHRLHYLLRQDLVHQLDDARTFSGAFKGQVERAVAGNVIADPPEEGASPRLLAEQKDSAVQTHAASAGRKLDRSYREYAADPSWQADLADTLTVAGEFKHNLGPIVKTEFTTPFDGLIGSSHILWLGWLDVLLQTKGERDDDELLFAKFLDRHPGLEHFAGVVRGGTLVLAYDTDGTVVADFMLPYVCCEPAVEETPEPPLPRPPFKQRFVLEDGVKVQPSRQRFVADQLTHFRAEIEPEWKEDIRIERNYVEVFKDSVRLMGNVFSGTRASGGQGSRGVEDSLLDFQLRDTRLQMEKVDFLRQETLRTDVDPERQRTLESQLRDAEVDLATKVGEVAKYTVDARLDVKAGGDGAAALATVSEGVTRLRHKDALAQGRKGLSTAGERASQEVKTALGRILKGLEG